MEILKEKDGQYSWRKIITCYALIQLAISINHYEFFDGRVLPKIYFALLSSIIAFYFSKELFTKKKLNENKK